jgi:signal transduction histidine kinase
VFYPEVDLKNGKPEFELEHAVADGRFEDEGWRLRKDGTRFWANVVITALRDANGNHVGFAKVTRDLTARKAAEQKAQELAAETKAREVVQEKNKELEGLAGQLRRQKSNLEETNARLKEALSRAEKARIQASIAEEREHDARAAAEEANRAKASFLAAMSHELRTPLNAIAGHIDLLSLGIYGELRTEQREALSRIKRAEQHLLHLIDDLLNFARIESGRVEYHIERVELRDLINDVNPMIAPQIAAKKLNYAVEMSGEPMWVTADRAKLVQIILNLLSNAVKFTDSGGSVKVVYCEPEQDDSTESVHLCVVDTGMGIPQEKLQAVFDPFVQLATSHSKRHEGTGLGLAISRDLARGMGGDIRATSEEGHGTTFMVVLSKAS